MEISEYKNIFEKEKSYFYYQGNHSLILSLANRFLTKKTSNRILDAGCGTGLLAHKLKKFGQVWGVDVSLDAIKFAKTYIKNTKLGSVAKLPFPSNFFDLVTSIDVIYHEMVTDDIQALNEMYRVLKPGGLLIIRVPAYNWLFRVSDKHVHTRQRYSLNELKLKMTKVGFLIERISYTNFVLLLPAIISWTIEKIFKPSSTHSPLTQVPNFINLLISRAISLESLIITRYRIPVGLGVVVVAKKPGPKNQV